MWMLFVMSLNYDGERKVTLYDNYQTEIGCRVVELLLTEEFEQGEKAFCHKVDYLKKRD